MLWPIRWAMWAFLRVLLSLRYKIRVVGKPEVFKKPGPYLILPNHPALVDPPNLIVHLWPIFLMRPMLLETNFRNPLLAPFAWRLRERSEEWVPKVRFQKHWPHKKYRPQVDNQVRRIHKRWVVRQDEIRTGLLEDFRF